MHLLILGGSIFLGRHLVEQALSAGHKVTILNRGRNTPPSQSALIKEKKLERLLADREQSLAILAGRRFDAVIDTCGYQRQVVQKSKDALKDSGAVYVFISTISVYGIYEKVGLNETDPIIYSTAGQENYGTLKAGCEKLVEEIKDHLIIRPGLLVGPHDPTDRFTYWPARIERGGDILAPGRPERQIQFIDVRDLVDFILVCLENKIRGTFNVTGPNQSLSMETFLQTCVATVGKDCRLHWVADEKLKGAGIQPWMGLPLWLAETDSDSAGFMQIDCSRAIEHGLKIRPLNDTILDTIRWKNSETERTIKTGLSVEQESALLGEVQ